MVKKFCEICDQPFELEEELSGPESILDIVCYPCYEEHDRELDREAKAKREAESAAEISREN